MSNATLARLVATVGGLGDRLPAPGTTAGSLPAALVWWALAVALPARPALAAATAAAVVIATAAGVWAADREAGRRGVSDPGPVVVDEVAGQWLTYLVALPWALRDGRVLATVAAGFLAFRLFDVAKPWPVRRLERLPGGVGIVADDLAAGVLAGAAVAIAYALGWL